MTEAGAEPERTQVDRPEPRRPAADRTDGDLGRPAPDVAHGDGPVTVEVLERTLEREARLLLLGQDTNLHPRRPRDQPHELVCIPCLPAGRSDDDVDQGRAHRAGVVDEFADALGSLGELRRRDRPELLDVAAETDDTLPAGDRRERPAHAGADQQADSVRADVDDRDIHVRNLRVSSGCKAGTLW